VTRVRFAFVVALAALAAFVPFAVKAWKKDAYGWDAALSRTARDYQNRETLLNKYVDVLDVVLHPATQFLGALVVVAVLLALAAHGNRRAALLLGFSVGGAVIAGPILKQFFERPPVDPTGSGYSFPSGHALRTMAAAAAIILVAWPTRWREASLVAGSLAVVLTGVAVVYHEWHWASDVIAGWCLGLAWVACVWLAVRPAYVARVGTRVGN
jgi:membrane-associated phospholipid phosphatase